jgi:hypothetical protein
MRGFLLMCASVYAAVMVLTMMFAFMLGVAYMFTGPSDNWVGLVVAAVAVPLGVLFVRLVAFCWECI